MAKKTRDMKRAVWDMQTPALIAAHVELLAGNETPEAKAILDEFSGAGKQFRNRVEGTAQMRIYLEKEVKVRGGKPRPVGSTGADRNTENLIDLAAELDRNRIKKEKGRSELWWED